MVAVASPREALSHVDVVAGARAGFCLSSRMAAAADWSLAEGLPPLAAAPAPPLHGVPAAPQAPMYGPGKTIASLIRSGYEAAMLQEDYNEAPLKVTPPSSGSGRRRPHVRSNSEGRSERSESHREVLEPLADVGTPREGRPPLPAPPLSARHGRLAALPATQADAGCSKATPSKPSRAPKTARSPRHASLRQASSSARGGESQKATTSASASGYPAASGTSYIEQLKEEAAMWEAKIASIAHGGLPFEYGDSADAVDALEACSSACVAADSQQDGFQLPFGENDGSAVNGCVSVEASEDTHGAHSTCAPPSACDSLDSEGMTSQTVIEQRSPAEPPEDETAESQISIALRAAGIEPGPEAAAEVMRRCEDSQSRPQSATWQNSSRQWAAHRLRNKGERLRSKAGTPCRSPSNADPLAQTCSSIDST
mmetsp:Transcript_15696/g.36824  ORF Transcript_15696/g.36824 Transcript_15696/m.36824 type:complete len:427 (+) Transcript_15696:60-1340(+)